MGETVALLHPGAMGASLGAAMVGAGQQVRWLAVGRSDATTRRAADAGLTASGSWAELLDGVEAVWSVCPPAAAASVAQEVAEAVAAAPAGAGRPAAGWCYVDANAISPQHAASVQHIVAAVGGRFVDGDVIGPPVGAGRTVVYLSGPHAESVADLFGPGPPQVVCLGDDPGAASTLKMLYAGWSKASQALLMTLWAAAKAAGVEAALAAEWQASQPDVAARLAQAASRAAPKAWRFSGEMHEVADTVGALGGPDGFWRAAAELFDRLAEFKDRPDVTLDEVVDVLTHRRPN